MLFSISPEALFYFQFILKLSLSAALVVGASLVIERSGPLIGALVVTLPVTVVPAFAFISLDHDARYMASFAIAGLAVNGVSAVFMLVYVVLAQKRNLIVSVGVSVVIWFILAWLIHLHSWSSLTAFLLNACLFPTCLFLSRHYRGHKIPPVKRQWYELPVRTMLVCLLMGTVLILSGFASPGTAGMWAVYPISTTSTMLIIQSAYGGRSSATVIANGLWGMVGIGLGIFFFGLTVEISVMLSIGVCIFVPVAWNMLVWLVYRRRSLVTSS